ncbi:MAG: DUF5693 family protein, partial [Endomicrobiales bacterium]
MKYFRYVCAAFFITLTIVVVIAIRKRIVAESKNPVVEICLDFNSINNVALHTGVPVKRILDAARTAGVSSVALLEDCLGQSEASDELLKCRYAMTAGTPPQGGFTPEYWNQSLPIGFSQEKINAIESAGLAVVLRPQNMGDPAWMTAHNAFAGRKVLLDGKEVPGYPDQVEVFKHLPDNPLVVLEFTSVAGIETLKQAFSHRIIQGHTIYPAEQIKNASDDIWIARWVRAVRERNNRFLLVYLREQSSLERNMTYLERITDSLGRAGFRPGLVSAPGYPYSTHPVVRLFVALVVAVLFPLTALVVSKHLRGPLVKFAVTNVVTLIGGLTVAVLLFDGSFMQRIIEIPYVKLVMLIPLFLSFFVLFPLKDMKLFWRQSLEMRHVVIFFFLASIFGLMLFRSGNTSLEWSKPDMGLRQWLEGLLVVRPRTKEILFGQPLLCAGFVSG